MCAHPHSHGTFGGFVQVDCLMSTIITFSSEFQFFLRKKNRVATFFKKTG